MDIEKHLNAWIDGDNYYLYKYLKEVVEYAIAKDRAERGDIVERLERLAEKHPWYFAMEYVEGEGWSIAASCDVDDDRKIKTGDHPTIPAVLEAAEKEVE